MWESERAWREEREETEGGRGCGGREKRKEVGRGKANHLLNVKPLTARFPIVKNYRFPGQT